MPAPIDRCALCGGVTAPIPVPQADQSVLSDGRLLSRPLGKLSCLECGATSHASALSAEDIGAICSRNYALPTAAPRADASRARTMASWLVEHLSPESAVLEIGCGSGALLRELSRLWPKVSCTGIDPALPEIGQPATEVQFKRAALTDLADDGIRFDLVIAVNVVEHILRPADFFSAVRYRLAAEGQVAVVYPAANPPNVELLFYDHIHSFTAAALCQVAALSGLLLTQIHQACSAIGDFELSIFCLKDGTRERFLEDEGQFAELSRARREYMENWIALDAMLCARLQSAATVVAFGSGQTSALIRAYAPRTWKRLEALIVDDVSDAWNLDKPVLAYTTALAIYRGATTVIATAPRFQKQISERLTQDGFCPIVFDDIIPR